MHTGTETTKKLMFGVDSGIDSGFITSVSIILAIGALIVTATSSIISCVAFEYLIQRYILKKPVSVTDGSAL
jgi:Na+-translocating ferredoxin:NAD+ oxidoreductase subunit D